MSITPGRDASMTLLIMRKECRLFRNSTLMYFTRSLIKNACASARGQDFLLKGS